MLKEPVIYLYYKYSIYKAVKKGNWKSYYGFLGFLGLGRNISTVVFSIKNGFIANLLLTSDQKNKLLKYCFEKIIYLKAEEELVKNLIINFVEDCEDYIAKWLRQRLSLFKLQIVKEAILNSENVNQYICDLLLCINNESNEEDSLRFSIGAKNSVPIELVQEMYELQAKGCPSKKPNKNENSN